MIDISKKYKTRDGRDVRIYAVDGGGDCPVQGAVYAAGEWLIMLWRTNGWRWSDAESNHDLIEVKPRHKREVWLNIFPDTMTMYSQKEKADNYADSRRIACIKVELDFEEWEGL